jgi:integrase
MPRRNTGARLRFVEKRGCFYIVWHDGRSRERSTGTADRASAEQALADFIHATKHKSKTIQADPGQVLVTDVLDDYAREHAPSTAAPWRIAHAVRSLVPFWQNRYVADITRNTCRAYERARARAAGTIRRELGVLSAAVNHAHKEGRLAHTVTVFLPDSPEGRERWLTRDEARELYRAALYIARDGRWPSLPLYILLALYTGQRKSAVLGLRWAQVDLRHGLIDFKTPGARRTNKRRARQPIAPLLLKRLKLAWRLRLPDDYVLHDNGRRLTDVKNSFPAACHLAGFTDVTPHTLRHTCATWLMQAGVPIWEAAGFVGMSQATMEKVYGHHHPDFMNNAVKALNSARGMSALPPKKGRLLAPP